MNDLKPPLTVEQAAKALNLSPSTIRYWIFSRRLIPIRLGRAVRIPHKTIEKILEHGLDAVAQDGGLERSRID